MKFLIALCVAAWSTCRRSPRTCITSGIGVLRALFSRDERVADTVRERRLQICRTCPVFYEPLETCGSALSDFPEVGCGCYMPVKAAARSNCWLWEQGIRDKGWPLHLNSFTENEPS